MMMMKTNGDDDVDDDYDVMMDVVNVNEHDLMKMNNYYSLNVMVEALNDDESFDDHHHY